MPPKGNDAFLRARAHVRLRERATALHLSTFICARLIGFAESAGSERKPLGGRVSLSGNAYTGGALIVSRLGVCARRREVPVPTAREPHRAKRRQLAFRAFPSSYRPPMLLRRLRELGEFLASSFSPRSLRLSGGVHSR